MIVLCDGMPRSASTWVFNICVDLVRRANPEQAVHKLYSDSVEAALSEIEPAYDHLIIKGHALDRLAKTLCRTGAARTVYTWRDPYDAVASLMRMFDYSFERSLGAVQSSIDVLRFHQSSGVGLVISYQAATLERRRTIERIAAYLGLNVTARQIAQIAKETSMERIKTFSSQIEQLGPERLVRDGQDAYDRETHIHANHIRDGSSGYGKRLLTPEQIATLESVLDVADFRSLVDQPTPVP